MTTRVPGEGSPDRAAFTRDRIIELLTELGSRLADAGVDGRLYVVGGAAMALEYDTRRVTRDIDAILDPPTTVTAVAREMAAELGLPPGWLSSSARAFMPGGDTEAVTFDVPGLSIALASPQHLIAMKLAAGRPQDLTDLRVLFQEAGVTTARQAADIAFTAYGDASVVLGESREDIELLAEAVLASMATPPGASSAEH